MRNFSTVILVYVWAGKHLDRCCRPIRMHEVWRDLGIRQHIVEQLSSLWQEVDVRQESMVYGKYGMSALMISLK